MTLRQLFEAFVAKAELEDGLVKVDSLDFESYRKIIPAKLVPEGVDGELLWEIVWVRLLPVGDPANRARAWTEQEKKSVVDRLCRLFENAPFNYDFFFKLPSTYPLGAQKLTAEIEVVVPDQKYINSLEKVNPISEFDKMLGRSGQKDNSRLIEVGEKYFKVADKGLVITGAHAYLEAGYSPDRLVGIFLALHLVYGNADTTSIKNERLDPKVYDSGRVYRANFVSPLKESRASSVKFNAVEDDIRSVNVVFAEILKQNKNSALEISRVQLINSLYWYIQSLNVSEPSLRVVFLVSAFDSLFAYKKGGLSVPAAREKVPVIAESVSNNEAERLELLQTLEELFIRRNGIIHGSTEIHGYNKLTRREVGQIAKLAESSEEIYKDFVSLKLNKYIS